MMFMNSQKTIVVSDSDTITLDYFVKSYIKYLSVFYCHNINTNDKKLNQMINNLNEYINKIAIEEEK